MYRDNFFLAPRLSFFDFLRRKNQNWYQNPGAVAVTRVRRRSTCASAAVIRCVHALRSVPAVVTAAALSRTNNPPRTFVRVCARASACSHVRKSVCKRLFCVCVCVWKLCATVDRPLINKRQRRAHVRHTHGAQGPPPPNKRFVVSPPPPPFYALTAAIVVVVVVVVVVVGPAAAGRAPPPR